MRITDKYRMSEQMRSHWRCTFYEEEKEKILQVAESVWTIPSQSDPATTYRITSLGKCECNDKANLHCVRYP